MLNYKIALTTVPFDDTYTHVRRFDTREQQRAYFNIDTLFANALECNFNVNTLINTTITVQYPEALNLNSLMSQNYAIVQDNTPILSDSDIKYYYYFIQSCRQRSGNILELNLELDVMQTYYIDLDLKNSKITRAHISRWVASTSKTVYNFNNYKDSILNKSENIEFNKFLKIREKLKIQYVIGSTHANNIFNETAWEYIFLVPSVKTSVSVFHNLWIKSEDNENIIEYELPYIVLCAPLKADLITLGGLPFNARALEQYIIDKELTANVIAKKISPIAPFYNKIYTLSSYTINEDKTSINIKTITEFNLNQITFDYKGNNYSFGVVNSQPNERFTYNVTISDLKQKFTFIADNPRPTRFDKSLEPKRLKSNVTELRIYDYNGNFFSYDPFLTSIGELEDYALNEFLTPDTTWGYIENKGGMNSIIDNTAIKEYICLLYNNDTSLAVSESQLDNFVANNKNFHAISEAQRQNNKLNSYQNAAFGLAGGLSMMALTGNPASAIGSAISGVSGLITTDRANDLSRLTEQLTLDNKKSAPDILRNTQGNILLPYLRSDHSLGFYVEVWQASDPDVVSYCEYLHQYGYVVDEIGDIHDFDNIREDFNHIEADIMNVVGLPVSNAVRNKLKQIFKRGVTFWNNDTYDLLSANWER